MLIYTVPYLEKCPFSRLIKYDLFPEVKALKEMMVQKYIVQIKITDFRFCAGYLNAHKLIWRPGKFKPIQLDNCKLIFGTPLSQGGSNNNPCPTFEEGYCIIETVCEGLPNIDFGQELVSIRKLDK